MSNSFPRRRLLSSFTGLAALGVVAGCTGKVPGPLGTPTPSGKAAELDGLVSGFIETYSYRDSVRSVLVNLDGQMLLERYTGSEPRRNHNVFSVTKSVVSALIGIALTEGALHGLADPLAKLLPSRRSQMPAKAAMITLEQLLTMTSGLPGTLNNNDQGKPPKDWVAAILALPVYTRRREFAYSDYGAHLVSAVLAEAIDVSVLEYARSRLFDPLGILTRPAAEPVAFLPANKDAYDKADFAWPIDPQGIHTGQALLKLTPPDMMKFGQLYLNEGSWQGRQVVPEAWVRESTRSHIATDLAEAEGYGYEWWTTTAAGDAAFCAVGYGGQLMFVVPARQLVIVVSSEVDENNPSSIVNSFDMVQLAAKIIAPAI